MVRDRETPSSNPGPDQPPNFKVVTLIPRRSQVMLRGREVEPRIPPEASGRGGRKRLVGYSQDDVADLLLSVHIPMGLDHILERIGAVDHHSISAGLD